MPVNYSCAVVTASDSSFAGTRRDESGPVLAALLEAEGFADVRCLLLPDDRARLENAFADLADHQDVQLILTTGGTGFSPRDVTPEATLAVVERPAPGIAEAIRAASLAITPRAMLSRATAGIRGKCLIINLPGSPKAVRECFAVIQPVLRHALDILCGNDSNCAAAASAGTAADTVAGTAAAAEE